MHNLLERVAQELWSRFAPEHHIEWEDEQCKAEYRSAAEAVLALASHTPAPQPAAHRRVQDAAPARPELDALIAEAKAPQPTQPGEAVKVKELEWRDREGVHPRYVAAAITGDYFIDRTKGGAFIWWTSALRGKVEVHTLDDAKAAAQADYERRILSAIEPSPSGWDAGAFEAGAKATREACVLAVDEFEPGGKRYDYGHDDASMRVAIRVAILALPLPTPAGEG